MRLDGTHVCVTGASRGLGEALARALHARGARLSLVARSEEPLRRLADEVGGWAVPADLTDTAVLGGLIARVEREAGAPVDLLVNNAGIDATGGLADADPEELARMVHLNLLVPVELSRQVLPGMRRRGRGHILNMSSLAGTAALPGMATYAATKAALTHFSAGLRAETRGEPIGVTVVEVGLVPTDMRDSVVAYGPTARSFRRLYRLGTLCDTPVDRLVSACVSAVERDRRHVRLPRRAVLFPLLAEAPRRIVEWLTAGVDPRSPG
ncbi:MAG: SDR family NAD(P)-dependent oxidoreductase [Miltoncostaeaceae bacterium]